jgi:hypothetical protein
MASPRESKNENKAGKILAPALLFGKMSLNPMRTLFSSSAEDGEWQLKDIDILDVGFYLWTVYSRRI